MNAYDQMRQAMREAKVVQSAADSVANDMAEMLSGRLKKVSRWRLAKLKRELRDFNMNTGRWK